jgi:protein-S-isoprenylcysteine O-methyltransferase Ste14
MTFNPQTAIGLIWETLGLLWLVGYAFTKPTLRAQPLLSRFFYIGVASFGFAFLGTSWFARGWLALRFVPNTEFVNVIGFVLTLAGAVFAAWARLTLGANWSGRPSVKAGHELVVTGPYSLARHPIYTGLLVAVIGTSLAVGQYRAILAVALILIALAAKITYEERLMLQTFPDDYPRYRARVRALIPGVL